MANTCRMQSNPIDRRDFVKTAGLGLAAASLSSMIPSSALAATPEPTPSALPHWKGFNFLDFFSPNPANSRPATPDDAFKWMRDWGFDFVRVPIAYPWYLNIDRSKETTPEDTYRIDEAQVARIDAFVERAQRAGMHVSLNLHRAPGYCVNAGFHEPFNLWRDQAALDAFCFHWEMWAKRYDGMPNRSISFDLVNEPSMRADMNDQHSARSAVPAEDYLRVAKAASERIRSITPGRLVIADGNNGGHTAVPELADLNLGQSCRGYVPFHISHYKAPWVFQDPESLPPPRWPNGEEENRAALEAFYQPWFDLQAQGVGVHCGECGCYNRTPHDVFLAWFGDVLSVLSERGIGFGLWEMIGDFGILDSDRSDVAYEDWHGHKLDRKLLQLLQRS